ncbi:MAG TPA: hypothetical protein GXX23_04515 [Firmicutes bacterium]|nr:hypothetical protein [Candidatus Fermentithermobacillaceae bacterium]
MQQLKQTHIIWIVLTVAVLLPLIFPLKLPLGPSPEGEAAYSFIDNLPQGSISIMVLETAPSNEGELWPMALAVARHHMEKQHRIIMATFVPDGTMYAEKIRALAESDYGYVYGKDLVILPYRAGGETALASMADNIRAAYQQDHYGTPLTDYPLWADVKSIKDISVISCYTAGDDHLWLARHVWAKYQVPCISGNIALSTPEAIVYFKNGQLVGLISGVKGAAFYEQKINMPGLATQSMDAQSIGHLYLLLLMIGGNIVYWKQKKDGKNGKQGAKKNV